ncbi:MAG: Tll0287-like domain-containing protein [Nitrospirales bacterium]
MRTHANRISPRHWWTVVGLGTGALLSASLFWSLSFGGKPHESPPGIPPSKVAAYVHAVIEADRTIYTSHVVERMQEKGITYAAEHWEQQNALPLPAQFLQYAGRLAAEGGSGIRYGLISLWPIRSGPTTEFERQALESLLRQPAQPVTGVVRSGRKQFFQAIYADRAVSKACVACHNHHPLSPKRDFQLHDVMGGIVITMPLG